MMRRRISLDGGGGNAGRGIEILSNGGGSNDPNAATSTLNHPHGTWVACMIAADVGFVFDNDDPFTPVISAVSKWAPTSVFPVDASSSMVPMQGAAPDARIYAMKVFTASGGGSSSSTVMAAMDRAITLRKNFNDGMPSVPVSGSGSEDDPYVYDSLPIGVVNHEPGWSNAQSGAQLDGRADQENAQGGNRYRESRPGTAARPR